jgi:hypothetical protein
MARFPRDTTSPSAQALLGNWFDGAEELSERLLPVDASCAGNQLPGVRQVGRSSFVHPDRRAGEVGGKRAGAAGVVEMYVRHHDVREILWPDPHGRQAFEDGSSRRCRSSLHEGGLFGGDEIGGRGLRPSAHQRVDPADS